MKIQLPSKQILPSLIAMGGQDGHGHEYGVNGQYLTKDDTPILPIMGEIHFSRVAPEAWREGLAKMRAGGVQIAATYVFWIHHEERIGEWDFTGSRCLRRFIEVCKEIDFPLWLRVGPWVHGECRNGGLPDWLANANDMQVRSDDPKYLYHVARYFDQIAAQCEGLTVKDGGPILGIQLENEYGHCGQNVSVEAGQNHLRTLKRMLNDRGIDAPYYTATAWGGAYVIEGEALPVMSGYVDAPWAQHIEEMPACENFLFTSFHDDSTVGMDLSITNTEHQLAYDVTKNPYLTCELGGGLQVTAHRRPYPYPQDIYAQSLCALGSGANILGYYMYHGGTNPDGHYSTLQESKETGYPNDLPVKSYDFQTCIRENGRVMESYHRLRTLHMLTADFGHLLAPAPPTFGSKPHSAEDMETPRITVRHNVQKQCGFIFINNHQRKRAMKPIQELGIELCGGYAATLWDLHVPSGECAILPYGLNMGTGILDWTNATLLCRLGNRFFFIADDLPRYEMTQGTADIVTLSRLEANRAWRFGDQLYITNATLFEMDGKLHAASTKAEETVTMYHSQGEPETFTLHFGQTISTAKMEIIQPGEYTVSLNYAQHIHEAYLCLPFIGDKAEVYHQDKLIADWFQTGETWELALKRYSFPEKLTVKIFPSRGDVYYDLPVNAGCELLEVSLMQEKLQTVSR